MEQAVEPTDGGTEGQMPPWLLPVAEEARLQALEAILRNIGAGD